MNAGPASGPRRVDGGLSANLQRQAVGPLGRHLVAEIDRYVSVAVRDRGRTYAAGAMIADLVVAPMTLRATVQGAGSATYSTEVRFVHTGDDIEIVDVVCTCPYEYWCKHGVAVVIVAAALLDRAEVAEEFLGGPTVARPVVPAAENFDRAAFAARLMAARGVPRAFSDVVDVAAQVLAPPPGVIERLDRT